MFARTKCLGGNEFAESAIDHSHGQKIMFQVSEGISSNISGGKRSIIDSFRISEF